MDPNIDFNSVKDRVLIEVGKSIKLIQCYAVCGFDGVAVLGNDSWLVQSLSHSLDLALRHGLRDPHRGYWTFVCEFTHSNTLQTLISLKNVHSPLGKGFDNALCVKGRAWLYFTVSEGSLSSYLQCLYCEQRSLRSHYASSALMRDPARLDQLITLLAGLDHIHFNLDVDVSYLDMSTYSHQDTSLPPDLLFLTKCNATMTASITSSLASPVDSGVALLDSDADATSVSEATLNGGDNLSLREDDSTLAELDDIKFTPSAPTPVGETVPVLTDDSASSTTCSDALKHHCVEVESEELSYMRKQISQNSLPAVANTTNNTNAPDTEKTLLQDAASNFIRKAVFHAAFITKSASGGDTCKDDTPIITVTKAQCPEESVNSTKSLDEYNSYLPFCEPETAIEVYEVCPIMTASDIANQNVEPIDTRALSFNRMPNVGRQKTGGVNSKNDITCDIAQLSEDIKFKDTQCNEQEEIVNSTSTDCDEIVFRRQRKKRNKNEVKVKRVSFHEDLIVGAAEDSNSMKCNGESIPDSTKKSENISDFSASFLPPNPIIKKDVIRGRYSWCAEGDAPYVSQRSNTRSEIFLSTNSDQPCNYALFNTSSNSFSKSSPNSPYNSQHVNKAVDGVYNSRNETNYQCKPESLTETLGHIESPVKLFPDRFYPQSDHSLFDDGNDTVLQMDALIQSTPSQADFKKVTSKLRSLPVTERGTPEGQEDPQRSCSTQHLCSNALQNYSFNLKKIPSVASSIDCFSDLESLRSDPDDRNKLSKNTVLYGSNSKVSQLDRVGGRRHSNIREYKKSLLNRFLKSVTVKKFVEKKTRISHPSRSLYIKGVKVDPDMNRKYNENLDAEIQKGLMELSPSCNTSIPVDSNLEMIFKSQIFVSQKEHIDKVFRVRSCYFVGEVTIPLLVLLTDVNLYITGSKMNHAYCNHLILPYMNLDSILVGPNSHCLMLLSANNDVQFTLTTGDSEMTHEIISSIEMRMRNIGLNPAAVRILELDDMKALKYYISKPADMSEDDLLHYYSLIHLQDDQHSSSSTPLGPTIEGHLMFRPATHTPLQPWTPAYCVLKAGVLYMFSDPDHQLPKRVLMLRNGHCKGCQRLKDRRPHTFAILLQGSGIRSLQFAAADEYQASDWLQAFIQAAAGVHEGEGVETTPCSLIVTSRHVVTCREQYPSGKAQALAVANIADITAFRAEHSWCVLEFACREVHESSGDWVLYFASVKEMEKFQESLKELWPQLKQTEFPLSAIVDESQRRRCLETGHVLAQVWEHLVPLSKVSCTVPIM